MKFLLIICGILAAGGLLTFAAVMWDAKKALKLERKQLEREEKKRKKRGK